MKKYPYQNIFKSLVYIYISLPLIGFTYVGFIADEFHLWLIIELIAGACFLWFYAFFSLTMRIQIDYEKKKLYIKFPYFIERIKFEDIKSIKTIDYDDVAFEFTIITEKFTRKIQYTRYSRKRPSEKITAKLNELKQDLMNISNKNY